MTPFRVGILGHVGNQNLGDEAILTAVIQNVRRLYPAVEIQGLTLNPADTSSRHGIPAYRIRKGVDGPTQAQPGATKSQDSGPVTTVRRRLKNLPIAGPVVRLIVSIFRVAIDAGQECGFLCQSYRRLRGLDVLIIAGSQQLNDFVGGPWAFPYTIFKWTVLARLSGARVAFLSLGAGPIRSALGRWFIRKSLLWADYRSYRDPGSIQVIEHLCVPGKNLLVPDLVFSHDVPDSVPLASRSDESLVIGMNPLPFFDPDYWHAADSAAYHRYVRMLAEFADSLIASGHSVSFFPTQLKVDPRVIRDIRSAMKRTERVIEPPVDGFERLAAAIRDTDIVIATRYHGILISLLLRKPVLALAYHGKSRDLMQLVGFPEYSMDVETCGSVELRERFASLVSRRFAVEAEIASRLPEIRRAVAQQYDCILAPLSDVVGAEALTSGKAV